MPSLPESHFQFSVPVRIAAPTIVTIATIYPAIWNPMPLIRHCFATALVLGVVWLGLALATFVNAALVQITDLVIDRQVQSLREIAFAELDSAEDAGWSEIVEGLTKDWPDALT